MERIGLVGLGTMGLPLVRHLLTAGYGVVAFDLDPAACQAAAEAGAGLADSAVTCARDAQLLLVSVSNQQITHELLVEQGLFEEMGAGGLVVDLGTMEPAMCRELAGHARKHGVQFLDAPLSGSTPWAQAGTLTVMVGGEEEAFARCLPVFRTFGEHIHYLGGSGAGQTVKLCHQLAFMTLLATLGEAAALGEQAGISPGKVMEVLDHCVSPSHVMAFLRPQIASGDWLQPTGNLALGKKDLHAVLETASQRGLDLPLASQATALFDEAAAQEPQLNLFGVVDWARRRATKS